MAREKGYQSVVLCNLVATTLCIALKYETSSASERPFHLSFCVLLLCGLFWSLIGSGGLSSNDGDILAKHNNHDLPKLEFGNDSRQYTARSRNWKSARQLPESNRYEMSSMLLVICIVLRTLLFRSIILDVECSWTGTKIFLPFLLTIFELATKRDRKWPTLRSWAPSTTDYPHSLRYVFLLTVWVLSAFGTVSFSSQRSTYICPSKDRWATIIHLFQCLELLLDAGIIIAVSNVSKGVKDSRKSWKLLYQLSFVSGGILGMLGSFFLWMNPEHINWSLCLGSNALFDLFFGSSLCTSFVGSIVYLMGELRLTTIFTIASCVSVYIATIQHQFADSSSHGPIIAASLIAFASALGLARMEKDASRSHQHLSLNQNSSRIWMSLCVFMALTTSFFGTKQVLYLSQNKWPIHPIEVLIFNARSTSDQWLKQAASSKSLEEAVVGYQSRYGIPPPPNFDKWFDFAKSRGSLIIDDFGQVHNDLLPFWGIPPAKIRQMTGHMLERPWTEVAGLRISNGTASLGPHVLPTHRWMLEGAADMINTFAKWIPDMDLAFNINDENRVAIPWTDMEDLKHLAKIAREQLNKTRALQSFSTITLQSWPGNFMKSGPLSDVTSEHFSEASLVSSFSNYGTISCPPSSLARTQTWANKKSLCHYCSSPHSLGSLLSNWTLSGSLCHQPDLANLHGFHLSPSAFKPTRLPFPIFSQAKIPSFSDIIFPSPWNYKDKVIYDNKKDMAFSEKENTLFWRGATSEGFSVGGTWKGMQRQRFVHLVDSPTNISTINVLLPTSSGSKRKSIPFSSLSSKTKINVSFVQHPTRCYGSDCALQRTELPFNSSAVDFQEHWQYKYLFDLDGAGFSGRFLPFLESHSLVFRVAAFRQWFDERLTAWRHFVPVDGRLTGVWDILAYFGGVEGLSGGEENAGERIAEEGRKWARKVLKKSDMEVYMFRLLLEWGRIVDDERGEMGFVVR